MRTLIIDPMFGGTTRTPMNIASFYREPGLGTAATMGVDALGFFPGSYTLGAGAKASGKRVAGQIAKGQKLPGSTIDLVKKN